MFGFLTLCAVVQAVASAQDPDPVFHLTVNAHVPRLDQPDNPATSNPNYRTEYDIVKSCLLTIFACVWTAIHPNIRDSVWTRFKRKVVLSLYAVVAPELMLWWAVQQYVSAKNIAQLYNQRFNVPEVPEEALPFSAKIKELFRPRPVATTRRGQGQNERWTIAHGFFIQMGGFILYENELPKETLDFNRLTVLPREGSIDRPTVTERELQDRSKGDAISKAIVVWQTTWFALQCITRLACQLPLAELEVLTLAFTVVNVATYFAWWHKPQSVDVAIWVPLKTSTPLPNNSISTPLIVEAAVIGAGCVGARNDIPISQPSKLYLPERHQTVHMTQPSGNPTASDEPICTRSTQPEDVVSHGSDNETWLQRTLHDDRKTQSPLMFLLCVPFRTAEYMFRPLTKIADPKQSRRTRYRIPMFYSAGLSRLGTTRMARGAVTFISVLFGTIHLIPWDTVNPSDRAQILWRGSALVLAAFPISYMVREALYDPEYSHIGFNVSWKKTILLINFLMTCLVFLILLLSYIPARVTVTVIAIRAIYRPQPNVLREAPWVSYIPHF